ncbi:Putative protein in type-1 retrotransposable element R1DM [Araneus ventricosus]|uniref:Retrovirus-related Pol polyprotein from type-1 retrotransposable element R1 n=1 Tax=Araneus ventricosus TaxID=182803 RepID=A0A4Y2PW87_ARAVE|nr:Putative protein in type-1 retrotransposable element R1DM [Araneus ventricosus]
MLAKTAKKELPDIILVQEPYVKDNKIEGLPGFWKSWLSKNNKAGIIALPTSNNPIFLLSGNDIVAIKIQGEDYLIGADLNAHSQSWGYSDFDTRGEKVLNFISSLNSQLLNTPGAPPSYEQRNTKGWPDVTIVSFTDLVNNSNWQVLEDLESYSDHIFIRIIINRDQHILSYNRFKTIFGGHKKCQNIIKLKAQNIPQRISNTNTPEELDDLTTFIQQEINMACRKSYKLKKTPSTPIISWWNPQLETRKKEISALKRRAQRSFDAEKVKIKQSIFKKEVLSAKRNCFKRNCTQNENVYGKFFKIAFKNSAPPTDLFTLIDNQQRGSPRDIAKSILKTLYPTAIETTNQIQSPKQPIIEPPFTNKELKEIIRFLPTNKAPGNDEIDFIIIKQLIQACPSILRNYYNKCLHLQKFSTPLKEGIIVLFHKKDNITNKTNVTESLKDILSNRKVIIQTQEGPAIWQQTKGCAQGSCSGPAFWNLVADNILKTDWPQNVHLQAFADDFAFVVSHKTKDGVQQLANRAITTFSNWAELNKLQISLEKTKYMYLGNLINPARIKWNNTRIQKESTLRYLGIIIDDKLKWIPHIKEKGTKALQQYQHFQRIAGKNWGLTTANRKLIYKTVIERMLCHGAVAWAQKITESMKRKLNTIQRKFLLLITKTYHTTATNSLQVITGSSPLHLTANKEAKFIKISRLRLPTQVLNTPLDPTKYEVIQRGHQMHPAKFLIDKQITTQPLKEYPTVSSTYTDGS